MCTTTLRSWFLTVDAMGTTEEQLIDQNAATFNTLCLSNFVSYSLHVVNSCFALRCAGCLLHVLRHQRFALRWIAAFVLMMTTTFGGNVAINAAVNPLVENLLALMVGGETGSGPGRDERFFPGIFIW